MKRKTRQVRRSVATVMPEMGFDEDPISPVSRDETVTKRKPNATIKRAPMAYVTGGRGSYWAGMVTKGSFSVAPVSASVKKNITAVSARFVCQSPSSTQNQ